MKVSVVLWGSWLALAGCGGSTVADLGLDVRVAATSVTIPTGNDSAAPLTAVDALPGLAFPGATFLTHAGDGSDRLFIPQRSGVISVVSNRAVQARANTFLDISAKVDAQDGEAGLLGLAFDPGFRTNGYFYVSHTTIVGGARKVSVARYRVSGSDRNVADPASERIVLEIDHSSSQHFGGWIGFGPDGALYIAHGDGLNQDEAQNTASLFGKVLRIRVNADGSAAIPADNPFGNAVWAYGFRNPWRCGFDRANGNLWCGDLGEGKREEINLVSRGANHGWPLFEGSLSFDNPANRPASSFVLPVHEYDHSLGVAVIGGYVYRGSALPDWVGRYLYADFSTPNLWSLEIDGNNQLITNDVLASNLAATYSLGEDEAGEIFATSSTGTVYRFEPADVSATRAAMPVTLSATGLFANLAKLEAAPGVIDYEVNSPFWSNGARKRRWFVLPGEQPIGFGIGDWQFPVGTITVKHFELATANGATTRLETRVMVRRPGGWVGYTYRWRSDQSDADLLLTGDTATFDTVNPVTGDATRVDWVFPSQAQCLNCHTQAAGYVLGLNTPQLNRNHTYSSTGRTDNQLRTLNGIGLFNRDIGAVEMLASLPDPADTSLSIERRARTYLDTNCSGCHRPGGPTGLNLDLRFLATLSETNTVGVSAGLPTSPGALRVAPGNHAASDLWKRAASTNSAERMPPLGVSLTDDVSLKLLADWIDGLR